MNDKSLRLLDLLRILDRQGKNELNKDDFISRLKVKLNLLFILNQIRLTFDLNIKKKQIFEPRFTQKEIVNIGSKISSEKVINFK